MQPLKIGILGCGNILPQYLATLTGRQDVALTVCSDIDADRAVRTAREAGIPSACPPDELYTRPDVDLVLNLTIPGAHVATSTKALAGGKHVYTEKPLGLETKGAAAMLDLARAKGLRLGCAPDTVLGAGIQTCRKAIDDGLIGRPLGAVGFMASHGPEDWHPNPAFLYHQGAGPLMDMGPYYLAALVNLLGPVKRVTASAKISLAQRPIGSEPLKGQMIKVEVPTYVAGNLEFQEGAIASLMISFDVWNSSLPLIEVYGTEGTLSVPDPNSFKGPVKFRTRRESDWKDVADLYDHQGLGRGLGILDMAAGLRQSRPHRASAEVGLHVLDIMESLHRSAEEGRHIAVQSQAERPALFSGPVDLALAGAEKMLA